MLGEIGGAIGSLFMGIGQQQLQRQQLKYQKELNNQLMQREDTAVQRRMNDLSQAGLSKNLATGAGFSAQTSPMSAGQPVSDGSSLIGQGFQHMGNAIGKGVADAQGIVDTINSVKQTANIEADTDEKKANADLARSKALTEASQRGLIDKEAAGKAILALTYANDLEMSQQFGIRTNDRLGQDTARGKNILGDKFSWQQHLREYAYTAQDIISSVFGKKGYPNSIDKTEEYEESYDERKGSFGKDGSKYKSKRTTIRKR